MPESLEQLQAAEEGAQVRVLTWMGMEGDRASETQVEMAQDADAYRTAVERRVRAEDEANFLTPPRRTLPPLPVHPNAGAAS